MNATKSKNRVSPYYDSPDLKAKSSAPLVVLLEPDSVPVGPIAKLEAFSEAVFESLQLLRTHLRHPDPELSQKAACTILSMQQTLLRHGGRLTGTATHDRVMPIEPSDRMAEARYQDLPGYDKKTEKQTHRAWLAAIKHLRARMQREADQRGLGEYIDFFQAELVYVEQKARSREAAAALTDSPTPSVQPPHRE